jgi:hypothetical protein
VAALIATARAATTTADQGKAYEDLVCYVFEQVPGITITHRNALNVFSSEEIDVALWNNAPHDGLFFLPHIILVECKNWSNPVGSNEVSWFDCKLRDRGLTFGVLVARHGITGDPADLSAAHNVVSRALREARRLIVITETEVQGLTSTEQLVDLLKLKLCQLAVSGALV